MKEVNKQWLCDALDRHAEDSLPVMYRKDPKTLQLEPYAYAVESIMDPGSFELHFNPNTGMEIREIFGFLNMQSAIEDGLSKFANSTSATFSRCYCG